MATELRIRIFSPLSAREAKSVVAEIDALIHTLTADAEDDDTRDDDGYGTLEIFDDITLVVDPASPPTAKDAHNRATATGYAASSLVLQRAALERLPSCRSTIVLDYFGRIAEKELLIALQKRLFDRVGKAVVESAEGSRFETSETFVAACAKAVGPRWAKTFPLGTIASTAKKSSKTRPAKTGEIEAVLVFRRLSDTIDGDDALARVALKKALAETTEHVRIYAAALLQDGPRADAVVAKAVSQTTEQVADSRETLDAILEELVED